jgi:hypothetical protein
VTAPHPRASSSVLIIAPRTPDFDALMAAARAKVPRAKVVLVTLRRFARYPSTDANVAAWNAHIRGRSSLSS